MNGTEKHISRVRKDGGHLVTALHQRSLYSLCDRPPRISFCLLIGLFWSFSRQKGVDAALFGGSLRNISRLF